MDFPTRIRQHKNESDSFAIILYKLREIGIFRNVTESDYGIDFEIEVVNGNKVQGHCIKVQVKSSDNLTVRQKDGIATVGGIEQSSLNYWAEISYNIPVVAIAVDIAFYRRMYMYPTHCSGRRFGNWTTLLDPSQLNSDRAMTIRRM